jgi:hypothetical protein
MMTARATCSLLTIGNCHVTPVPLLFPVSQFQELIHALLLLKSKAFSREERQSPIIGRNEPTHVTSPSLRVICPTADSSQIRAAAAWIGESGDADESGLRENIAEIIS